MVVNANSRKFGITVRSPHDRLHIHLNWLAHKSERYAVDKVRSHLYRFIKAKGIEHETTYREDINWSRILDETMTVVMHDMDKQFPELYADEHNHAAKHFGKQGGIAPWSAWRGTTIDYCTPPDTQAIDLPAEMLLEAVQAFVASSTGNPHTVRLLSEDETRNEYRAKKKSNSGITHWTDRRAEDIIEDCAKHAWQAPFDFDWVVTAIRLQRNKIRNIFMDSFDNFFRYARIINPMHRFFTESPIPSWKGDFVVERNAYQFMAATNNHFTAIGQDVDRMDIRMQAPIVAQILGLITQVIGTRMNYAKELRRLVKATFKMPFLTPEGLMIAERLLSGLPPTNDWETYVSAIECETFLRRFQINDGTARLLADIPHQIHVKGDDTVILIEGHLVDSLICTLTGAVMDIRAAAVDHMGRFGLVANVSKQDVWFDTFSYCKRRYYNNLKQYTDPTGSRHPSSAYPLVLALNSIAHPEQLNHPDWQEYHAVRIYQILDNCYGHPRWKAFVRTLVNHGVIPTSAPTHADVEHFNATMPDWRFYLYGELFQLESSMTFKLLQEWKIVSQQPDESHDQEASV